MIISFMRASRCTTCKRRRAKGETGWCGFQFSMSSGLLRWLQPRFPICPSCANQLIEQADRNPKLAVRRLLGQ